MPEGNPVRSSSAESTSMNAKSISLFISCCYCVQCHIHLQSFLRKARPSTVPRSLLLVICFTADAACWFDWYATRHMNPIVVKYHTWLVCESCCQCASAVQSPCAVWPLFAGAAGFFAVWVYATVFGHCPRARGSVLKLYIWAMDVGSSMHMSLLSRFWCFTLVLMIAMIHDRLGLSNPTWSRTCPRLNFKPSCEIWCFSTVF